MRYLSLRNLVAAAALVPMPVVLVGLSQPTAPLATPPGPAVPPPATDGSEEPTKELAASLGRYESCAKQIGILVRELDRLMEHRQPCPECGGGGGGRDHPHSIGRSWKDGSPEAPESVRKEWDATLSKLSREIVKLDRAREEYLRLAGVLGMKSPPDTAKNKIRMELHGSVLRQFLETLRGRLLERYLMSQREIRATIAPDEVSKATVPVPKPPAPPGSPTPGTGGGTPGGPPASPSTPQGPGGGGTSSSPQPKPLTPEEIGRKRTALSEAIRKHDEAIGELRGLVDRFDVLINHRNPCPECGGGGGDRNHSHAVFRAWRDTGGPLPDKVRDESERVQRKIGTAISAALAATKVAERITKDLAGNAPQDAVASLQRMQSRTAALEAYDRTLERNKHETYDATFAAMRGALR